MTERTKEDLGAEVVALRESYRVLSSRVQDCLKDLKRADDQLDIIRRSAERGVAFAEKEQSIHIDLYIHIKDETQRAQSAISAARGHHQRYG